MANDKNRKPEQELVDHILAFAENPDEDILSMSPADVDLYLKEEGIDTSAGFRALTTKLEMIKKQRRLAAARQRREMFAEQLAHLVAKPKDALTGVREEIAQRLHAMGQSEASAVYFRKLEGATDKDLESILEDMKLLNELDEGGPQ